MLEETKTDNIFAPTDKLGKVFNSLSGKNPLIKSRGYDGFVDDMKDDAKLQKVFNSLSIKNPMIKERGFDGFKTDMFGQGQQPPIDNQY